MKLLKLESINSVQAYMVGLLLILLVGLGLVSAPLVLFQASRSQPRLNAYELVRLIRGQPLASPVGGLVRRLDQEPPAISETKAEIILAGVIAAELGTTPSRVRIRLDEDDRAYGESYARSLATYGAAYGSSLTIDGSFMVAAEQQPGKWTVVAFTTPARLGVVRLSILSSFMILAFLVASRWFAARIIRPLETLAESVEQLGSGSAVAPISIEGPAEVQTISRALNQMQEQIRVHIRQRTAMLVAIAHDLRSPLARIKFHLASPGNSQAAIESDIRDMEQLITSTLHFAEGEARPADLEPLDLPSLVESIVCDFSDAGFDVRMEASQPFEIQGDASLLKRMGANLIDNAVKYAGSASVRVQRANGVACVEVADRGPGLRIEQRKRALEPFYRGASSRSGVAGAGLGLAIVDAAAKAHGGKVELNDEPGGGLSVRVELPTDKR